ncbi:MAG: aminotransferase class IV [Candidatus Binatia bacterium]
MKAVCYLNGRFMDVSKARISPLDRGFLFGEGLFETWRTYKGRAYGLPDHLARMAKSARHIGIPFDPDEAWEKRCIELARRNGMLKEDGAVRMTITRGRGPVSLTVDKTEEPTTLMLFRPLEPTLALAKSKGVAVHMVSVGTGVSERWRQVKSLNYLPAILARVEAKKHRCFEAVYHTEGSGKAGSGTVLEGTTSNLFVVRRGIVRTAPISAGLLPGVTRKKTLRLARAVATVKEERFSVADLMAADEVFLTASSIEVVPVVKVGRQKIGNGRPGPIALAIQRRYREEVARKLGLALEDLGD